MNHWAVALLMVVTTSVANSEERTVMHDGAQMRLVVSPDDQSLELRYTDPPAQLREIGVASDTVLVRGHWENTMLVGEAFMFSSNCRPIAYPVRGTVDLTWALVVMGPVPEITPDCEVSRSLWDERSVMRFEQVRIGAPPKQAKAKPKDKPKAKPKPRSRTTPSVPQQSPYYPQQWRWF